MNTDFYSTTKYRILFKDHEQALKERFDKDCLWVCDGHFITLTETKIAYLYATQNESKRFLLDNSEKPTEITTIEPAIKLYQTALKRYSANLKKLEKCRSIEDLENVQYD